MSVDKDGKVTNILYVKFCTFIEVAGARIPYALSTCEARLAAAARAPILL
jgi:hypothetical protein